MARLQATRVRVFLLSVHDNNVLHWWLWVLMMSHAMAINPPPLPSHPPLWALTSKDVMYTNSIRRRAMTHEAVVRLVGAGKTRHSG